MEFLVDGKSIALLIFVCSCGADFNCLDYDTKPYICQASKEPDVFYIPNHWCTFTNHRRYIDNDFVGCTTRALCRDYNSNKYWTAQLFNPTEEKQWSWWNQELASVVTGNLDRGPTRNNVFCSTSFITVILEE